MIKIPIGFEKVDIRWSEKLALKRSGSMGHKDTKNSFNMGFKKKFHRHWCGACGERVWSKFSGHPVDTETIGIGDTGTDFPGGYQIKASWIKKTPNLLIPVSQWERKTAKKYVLVWVQRPYSFILGEITRAKARQKRIFTREGVKGMYCDTWFIGNKYLTEITIERAEGSWEAPWAGGSE